jgi:hypothetical protein
MAGRISLTLAAGALWLALAPGSARSQEPGGFALAVVDTAGVLEPVARFDGTTWERIWDEPKPKADLPVALDRIPAAWFPPDGRVPTLWYLWLVDDPRAISAPFEERSGQPLTTGAPVLLRVGCQERIALGSNDRGAASQETSGGDAPRLKAGVALTDKAIRVEQATILRPDAPLLQSVTDRAVAAFHRAEEDQLELLEPAARKGVPAFSARRTAPVRWTRAVRLGVAQAPRRTFYLEGEAVYGAIVMTGHVWVQIDRDRDTLDAEVALTDPDRKEVRLRTPLGVLRVGDRRFWMFDVRVWEHVLYEIVEASGQGARPATVLEVPAGGC